jgi:hypothetical protein
MGHVIADSSPLSSPEASPIPESPAVKTPASSKKRTPKKATPAKKTPAQTPSRARSSRAKKPVTRYVDEQTAAVTKPKAAPRTTGSKVFDPKYITTDSRSRLVKTDIYHLLMEESAWACLSGEQQTRLISMLPPTAANQALLASLSGDSAAVQRPKELSLGFEPFRSDVSAYKRDLANGQYGKAWLSQAEQAVKDRAAGKFDAWKAEETEEWWGQKMK